MMKRTTFIALTFALITSMALTACGTSQLRGGVLEPAAKAPEMVLTDQRGESFHLSGQQGKVVLLFFGYTSCPDVCPTTLAVLAKVARELGDKAAGVQVAFVSVDPNDTPQKLAQYVKLFNPKLHWPYWIRDRIAARDEVVSGEGNTARYAGIGRRLQHRP